MTITPIKTKDICGKKLIEYGNNVWNTIDANNVNVDSTTLIKLNTRPCSFVFAVFDNIDRIAVGENRDKESNTTTKKAIKFRKSGIKLKLTEIDRYCIPRYS